MIIKSTYDFCLFYINSNNKGFGKISLEINNILILANNIFAIIKEKKLKKGKLLEKDWEKLIVNTSIKFNRGYIKQVNDNSLFLAQKSSATTYISL